MICSISSSWLYAVKTGERLVNVQISGCKGTCGIDHPFAKGVNGKLMQRCEHLQC